jgi:hypothetical protein
MYYIYMYFIIYIYIYIIIFIIITIIIIVIIIILYIHTLIQTVFVLFWWTQMSGTPFFEQGWPASGWATILRGWRSHPRWNLTVGLSLRDIIDIFKEWTRKDATDIVHLYPSRMLLYVCFCLFFRQIARVAQNIENQCFQDLVRRWWLPPNIFRAHMEDG